MRLFFLTECKAHSQLVQRVYKSGERAPKCESRKDLHVQLRADALDDGEYFWFAAGAIPFRVFARNNSAVSSKEAYEQYQCGIVHAQAHALAFRMATPMNYIENKRVSARHVHLLHTTSMKMYTLVLLPGRFGHDGARIEVTPATSSSDSCYIRRSELLGNTAIATVLRAPKVWEYKSSHVVQNIEDVVQTLRGKSTTTPIIVLADKDFEFSNEIVLHCHTLGFARIAVCRNEVITCSIM